MTIPQYCLQISELLKESEHDWSHGFKWFANEYENDPNETLKEILRRYGGMGSFSDLVLYKNGQVDLAAMEKLRQLQDDLYNKSVEETIALRSQ